jgi:hypothetical protein
MSWISALKSLAETGAWQPQIGSRQAAWSSELEANVGPTSQTHSTPGAMADTHALARGLTSRVTRYVVRYLKGPRAGHIQEHGAVS